MHCHPPHNSQVYAVHRVKLIVVFLEGAERSAVAQTHTVIVAYISRVPAGSHDAADNGWGNMYFL